MKATEFFNRTQKCECNSGHTGTTNCCGAEMYEETDICTHCKDHADDECEICNGIGYVEPLKEMA